MRLTKPILLVFTDHHASDIALYFCPQLNHHLPLYVNPVHHVSHRPSGEFDDVLSDELIDIESTTWCRKDSRLLQDAVEHSLIQDPNLLRLKRT